jgi:hypothetical protein
MDLGNLASLRYFYPELMLTAGMLAVVLMGVLVAALLHFLHGPVVTDRVALNFFSPVAWVERADWGPNWPSRWRANSAVR